MNPEVIKNIADRLAAYRSWSSDKEIEKCRLVQYCGPDVAAMDIPLGEIEEGIEGLLGEGFSSTGSALGRSCIFACGSSGSMSLPGNLFQLKSLYGAFLLKRIEFGIARHRRTEDRRREVVTEL